MITGWDAEDNLSNAQKDDLMKFHLLKTGKKYM